MNKKSTLFNVFTIYFICMLLFVLIRVLVLVIDIQIDANILDLITTIIVQVGIMFLLPIFLYSRFRKKKMKQTFTDFNYSKISFYSIILSILIGFLCYFLNAIVASFFGSIIRLMGYESAPTISTAVSGDYSILSFITNVLFVAILPAICEETTHRGLLLKGLSSLGIKNSVIISSLLFGLMHLNINQFFYATVLGFIIAFAVIASKNIIPAIIIHFMNNFLSTYFSFARVNNWFGIDLYYFMTGYSSSTNLVSFFVNNILILAILLFAIVFLFTLLLKDNRIKKVKKMLISIEEINKEYNNSSELSHNYNLNNLHNLNSLMKEYNIKGLNSMVFTELENRSQKLTAGEIILIVSCFVIGGLITSFTFIWGLI